ncbi:GNAT family N-acetyltransferase [Sphingobacterium bambusae]|uniref:GNAT family N-acetyltransferase n=1 Tax=Sphingobacterium bambusae TaxID=662858 RepID=A0ABW6BKU7_9SPHI|nr:GNAT family N-acetyltransferase [Sphingobacterium bambusae]WPL48017.1 GNAT family N-acetyltransferase [Sphingobacterium bambusae]
MELIHVEDQSKWLALNDEVQIGELVYTRNERTLTITNTEVEPYYRGNKIAEELVLAAIKLARDNGLKVVPACSFAETVFERYPDERDVLA